MPWWAWFILVLTLLDILGRRLDRRNIDHLADKIRELDAPDRPYGL